VSRRRVTSSLRCTVVEPAYVELQVAVAAGHRADEVLEVRLDGRPVRSTEHGTTAGGRLHLLHAQPGQLEVRYRADVHGTAAPVEIEPLDASVFLRPSRYAESDRLGPVALAELGGLTGADELLPAVAAWVGTRLQYVTGSSAPTDGAVETMLARRGVCRDFAHLTVALLRALDVPARLVSVYAPGLSPMDFHAVAEGLVDGAWHVVDATLLAPRSSLVRIATGRDAADTAFLSTYGGEVRFDSLEVSAVVDGHLPQDDPAQPVRLS
jgi:transglutaminase-like putative cysteine protease